MASLITGPVVPQISLLRKQDYPDGLGTQDGIDKFFTVINPFFQGIVNALDGSLSIANLNGEVISFQITTPSTDWVTLSLASGWTSSIANSQGFPSPRYRINSDGQVQFSGACEYQTAIVPSIPIPLSSVGAVPAAGQLTAPVFTNEDMIAWVQLFSAAGAEQNGTALIRADSTGTLTLRSTSTVATAAGTGTANAIQFLSLAGLFYTPATVIPGVLSCFPKLIKLQGSGQPVDLWVTSITDAAAGSTAGGTVPAFAPGGVAWKRVNTGASGANQVSINNIPGLRLGRTYNIRCWVQYSSGTGSAATGVNVGGQ